MCTDSSKGDIDLPTGKVAQFKLVTQTGLQQILQIVIFLLIYGNYSLKHTLLMRSTLYPNLYLSCGQSIVYLNNIVRF